jgi:hypothetical protein
MEGLKVDKPSHRSGIYVRKQYERMKKKKKSSNTKEKGKSFHYCCQPFVTFQAAEFQIWKGVFFFVFMKKRKEER